MTNLEVITVLVFNYHSYILPAVIIFLRILDVH